MTGTPPDIGELLIKAKLINENQLAKARKEQRPIAVDRAKLVKTHPKHRWGAGRLTATLKELGYVTEEDILNCLSQHYGVWPINLKDLDCDGDIVHLLPDDFSYQFQVIPVSLTGDTLTLAMANPSNSFAIYQVSCITGYRIEPVVATEEALQEMLRNYHPVSSSSAVYESMPEGTQRETEESYEQLLAFPDETLEEILPSSITGETREERLAWHRDHWGLDENGKAIPGHRWRGWESPPGPSFWQQKSGLGITFGELYQGMSAEMDRQRKRRESSDRRRAFFGKIFGAIGRVFGTGQKS